MLPLYMLFYILIRIYVFAKIFYLMFMTYFYPESYPIDTLTWWIYYLVFDIWISQMLSDSKRIKKNNNNDESLS